MARGILSHLTNLTQPLEWGEKRGKNRERKGKGEKGRDFRERRSTFSLKFSDDRTVESLRAKRQSCSPLQDLRVGTGFVEFRQLQEVGFSPTCFILWLKAILMDSDILRPGWPCFRFQKIWTK